MTTSNQDARDDWGALSNNATYVARLTPVGRAAVAVVGVSGGSAWELLSSCWTDSRGVMAKELELKRRSAASQRPLFGLFHFDETDNGVADEVVLYRRTVDSFEIDCHGGDRVTSRIVEFFESRGAKLISSLEWERRVAKKERQRSDNVASDVEELFFVAADELIAQTTSEEAAKLAVDQRSAWRDWFLAFREIEDGAEQGAKIDELLNDSLGRYLTEPFVVALLGAPNVGKSSLLNAILGYERAVASPISGTTRDLVGAPFVLGGWNYQFVDAAGLRETADPIEKAGIALLAELTDRADVVVRIFDPTQGREEQERVLQRFFSESPANVERRALDVLNKSDLASEFWTHGWKTCRFCDMLRVSAREGTGVEETLAAIYRATVVARRGVVEQSKRGRPLLWSEEQRLFMKRLRAHCVAGRKNEVFDLIRL